MTMTDLLRPRSLPHPDDEGVPDDDVTKIAGAMQNFEASLSKDGIMQNFEASLAKDLGSLQGRILELCGEALSPLQLEASSLRGQLLALEKQKECAKKAFLKRTTADRPYSEKRLETKQEQPIQAGQLDNTLQSTGMDVALSLAAAWSKEQPEDVACNLTSALLESWTLEASSPKNADQGASHTNHGLTAVERWELMWLNLKAQGSIKRSTSSQLYSLDEYWGLHKTWSLKEGDRVSKQNSMTKDIKFAQVTSNTWVSPGTYGRLESCGDCLRWESRWPCLRYCAFNPNSMNRWSWAVVGVGILMIDVIMIPMQAVGLVDMLPRAVDVSTCAYWVIDFPVQMLTGIDVDGVIDMRPSSTIKQYLKTWMLPDLCFTLLDVCMLLMQIHEGSYRAGESLRVVRLVRIMRIVRAHKLRPVLKMIENSIFSSHLVLILKLFWLVVWMLFFNHWIACAWYGSSAHSTGQHTWHETFVVDPDNAWLSYSSALHWSLCQFSPATNNIAPQNFEERVFATCVAVFGLVIFSSFVSNVTNSVNQLRVLTMHKITQRQKMLDFLQRMQVSTELGRRIQVFFDTNFGKQSRPVQEGDVQLFDTLPQNLLIRLHKEIYFSALQQSVIYKLCDFNNLELIVQICHTAMSEVHYAPHQDVFIDGTDCSLMYHVRTGHLIYQPYFVISEQDQAREVNIIPGVWLSEAALWLQWVHAGHLETRVACSVLGLSSESVRSTVARRGGPVFESMRFYAILFVSYFEESSEHAEKLTDLPIHSSAEQELVDRAIKMNEGFSMKRNSGSKVSQGGVWGLMGPKMFHQRASIKNVLKGVSSMNVSHYFGH